MAINRGVRQPWISTTWRRRRRPPRSDRPMQAPERMGQPEPALSPAMQPAAPQSAAAVRQQAAPPPVPVAAARGPAPLSAAPAKATPSPAQRLRQRSLEKVMCSYFGPAADQIVIDTSQFDRFRVISPETPDQCLDCGVEIEDQTAGVSISYHALQPEKRRHAHASCDRRDHMQTRRRINYEIAGRQLDFMGTVDILDHEFAAVILIRLR